MLPPELKPLSKPLVYDLVSQAGVNTSGWANFKGDHPSSNPKYCYEWAFWDDQKKIVVLCLWYSDLEVENDQVSQKLNYRDLASVSSHRDPSAGVRAKRAARMDQAFLMAWKRKLPVRVIIVDGPRRGEAGVDSSEVQNRMLDPMEWHVATYDLESGECVVVRSEREESAGKSEGAGGNVHRLARIAYNSSGWKQPTGDAKKYEAPGAFNHEHGFGHEDWLFRDEWRIADWRYAFIQGLNNSRIKYLGVPLNITLIRSSRTNDGAWWRPSTS